MQELLRKIIEFSIRWRIDQCAKIDGIIFESWVSQKKKSWLIGGELEEYAKGSNMRNPSQPAQQDQKFSRGIRKKIEKIMKEWIKIIKVMKSRNALRT